MPKKFLSEYFERYTVAMRVDVSDMLIEAMQMIKSANASGNKLLIAGNGGSAAISSHASVDFTKQARVRAMNFNESDLITCFANDFGFEHWVSKAIECYADEGDIVILISSSGSSANIVNAAKTASQKGLKVITFSGFEESNPLKQLGDINFWLPSQAYNIIENMHQIWLLAVCDMLIGKAEYPVVRKD